MIFVLGIHDLPDEAQRQLFDENLDQDVQKGLYQLSYTWQNMTLGMDMWPIS